MNLTKNSLGNQIKHRKRINYNNIILLSVLVMILIIFTVFGKREFFNYNNLATLLKNMAVPGIIALGLTPLMISRGIDISFGANLGLSSVVIATLYANGVNIYIALLLGILLSTFLGFLNGTIIESFKLNPLIATLGTMSVFMAISLIITHGNKPISIIADATLKLAFGSFLRIPIALWFFIILILIYYFIINFTVAGRVVYLIGANPLGAYSTGIKIKKIRIVLYSFFGMMVGIASLIAMSSSGTGNAVLGLGLLLPTLSGILLGGIGLEGGSGTIWGTFLGVSIVHILFNGLTIIGIESNIIEVIKGALLIIIVSIYSINSRRGTN